MEAKPTPRQGEGVSLEVQKDCIARYSEHHQLPVELWLEEKETAAKRGRPVFNQAVKLLQQKKYKGIMVHKLDRSTRNLKDWAEIGELVDAGIDVHFVTQNLDLNTRSGRLSADIQAVVAADFIRNQKEETKKGLEGRLKQGIYPFRAPIGYLDNGKGKVKTIDPVKGPLVRKAFELYGTAAYSLERLEEEMYRLGLQNLKGGRVTRNGLATILHNQFYMGLMHIKKSNEIYIGQHQPIISKSLFDRVQRVLSGKINARTQRHAFTFRRLLSCGTCGYSLIGERQKGSVYYRCHGKHVKSASIREDVVDNKMRRLLTTLTFGDEEKTYFKSRLLKMQEDWEWIPTHCWLPSNCQVQAILPRP